jgi:hypothetical protein
MNGNKTKNQANFLYPAPHIRFSTKVQNRTYNIFIMKMIETFETSHEKLPKQYIFLFPKFWKNIRIIAMEEIPR